MKPVRFPRALLPALAIAAFASGCLDSVIGPIGPGPVTPERNPYIRQDSSGDGGQSIGARRHESTSPTNAGREPDAKRFPCIRVEETLRVHVDVANTPHGFSIAEEHLAALRDALARARFTQDWDAASDREDVLVALRASRTVADRFGEYEVHEGDIRVSVTVPVLSGKVVGDKLFHGKGARALGGDAADRALADVIVPHVVRWVRGNVTPETVGIAAEGYTIQYDGADPEENQRHAQAFLRRVQGMDGVLEARIVGQNDGRGSVSFRFVYLPAKFPGGLVNVAVLTDPLLQLSPSSGTPDISR